jgi:hypothetical protein
VWIFIGFLLLYHVNGRHLAEVDCTPAPYTAVTLLEESSFDLRGYPELRVQARSAVRDRPDGSLLSKYPQGSSLAAVPFAAAAAAFGVPPARSHSSMARFGKWVASVYTAGVAVLIFLVCRAVAPSAAWPTVVLVAAGSTLWSTASQALWAHGPATFFIATALFALVRRPDGPGLAGSLVAGLALGLAITCRPSTGLFALASLGALALNHRWRESATLLLPVLLLGCGLLAYNVLHFDHALGGGYLAETYRFETPLRVGLAGLLVAPSRGLLIYSPALLLVPLGLRRLLRGVPLDRTRNSVVIAWLGAAVVTLLFYARWHMWWGGWSFGPRFLTESIPIFGVLFAFAYQELETQFGQAGRRAGWALVWLSVAIHFAGVFGHGTDWMADKTGSDMFSLEGTQLAAHASHLWNDRPAALLLPVTVGIGAWLVRRRRHAEAPPHHANSNPGPGGKLS